MKIGISYINVWQEDYFKKIKAIGFDCQDYGLASTTVEPYTCDEQGFREFLTETKKRADAAGVTIWQVHGPWRFPPRDRTLRDRAERLESMKRSIKAAAILGAKYWVVHPIMPFGLKDTVYGNAERTRELNLEFMNKLAVTAGDEGVTVCLENMPFVKFSLSSPTAIAEVVHEINSPNFAMCLDSGHANVCRNWLTPAESIRKHGDVIKALHVHDNYGKDDLHLLPLHGTIDWRDFSRALHEVNFDGVLSLECTPRKTLPNDILEDMYAVYYKIAKTVSELYME